MPEQNPIPVLLLFGPTASGKTGLIEELFACRNPLLPVEIVSADSMQVYRGMDIGTAKPSPEEQLRIPHHLIDICDPDEQFNAGDFVRMADEACKSIHSRGKIPLISGGTGFYLKNFVMGLPEAPPADPETRSTLKMELETKGSAALFKELGHKDPVSAERIHPNDSYRLLRALEVCRFTGKPLSSFAASSSLPRKTYRFLLVGLERKRSELYTRIEKRCDLMFEQGLPLELKTLRDAGYRASDPGMRAIGYQEFFIGEEELSDQVDTVKALIVRNSRRYAKRQICFFSSLPDVHWIPAVSDMKETIARLQALAGSWIAV